MFGDCSRSKPDVCECEIVRDDRTPARRTEFDGCRHFQTKMLPPSGSYCSLPRKRETPRKWGERERVTGQEDSLTDKCLVLVTCASAAEAKRIARVIVEAQLAACVNILPGTVSSIYRWKGKVESARERLLFIKTSQDRLSKLQAAVERLHSYEVPEFIALPIAAGSRAYLAWLGEK
jgi:periplasmic divalent cation tolerance protein